MLALTAHFFRLSFLVFLVVSVSGVFRCSRCSCVLRSTMVSCLTYVFRFIFPVMFLTPITCLYPHLSPVNSKKHKKNRKVWVAVKETSEFSFSK